MLVPQFSFTVQNHPDSSQYRVKAIAEFDKQVLNLTKYITFTEVIKEQLLIL